MVAGVIGNSLSIKLGARTLKVGIESSSYILSSIPISLPPQAFDSHDRIQNLQSKVEREERSLYQSSSSRWLPVRSLNRNVTIANRIKWVSCPPDTWFPNDHYEKSNDLNNGSGVDTSCPEIIIAHTNRNYYHGDKGSVIHVLSRDWQL